jgi:hypothetical protein
MGPGDCRERNEEPEKRIRQAASDALHKLQTEEGRRELGNLLQTASKENDELRRRTLVDPDSLRKPVTL